MEERKQDRVDISLPCAISINGYTSKGKVKNISNEGICAQVKRIPGIVREDIFMIKFRDKEYNLKKGLPELQCIEGTFWVIYVEDIEDTDEMRIGGKLTIPSGLYKKYTQEIESEIFMHGYFIKKAGKTKTYFDLEEE